ncbi:MAG: hypothetical protein WEE89_02665 [Gemmatimonadota bacterium]
MLQNTRTAALTGVILILFGCERSAERAAQDPPAAAPAPPGDLVPGTPPGDLEEWIADVQTGLDTATGGSNVDAAAVHRQVLDLYVSRQEYIEMYYGPGGRMSPTPALSEAVKQAEMRFHEVMRLTGSTPPAGQTAIAIAIGDLKAQYRMVLQEAKQTSKRLRREVQSAQ